MSDNREWIKFCQKLPGAVRDSLSDRGILDIVSNEIDRLQSELAALKEDKDKIEYIHQAEMTMYEELKASYRLLQYENLALKKKTGE